MTNLILNSPEYISKKSEILQKMGVDMSKFEVQSAIRSRIDYLKGFIKNTGLKGFVLGISGGVDSSTAGRLAQLACEELRSEGVSAQFIAMRLPAGIQRDEDDAQKALDFINPDIRLTVNIGEYSDELNKECVAAIVSTGKELTPSQIDFNKGNAKARIRMSSQYYVAGVYGMAVVSTDHNSENCTGFFTKFGDGAADLTVLDGLIKTQVRMVAKELGAPEKLWNKAPTADLEELNPGKLDDEGFGFPYADLDSFLMGKEISPEIEFKIVKQYIITQHKRDPIVSFSEFKS
jgi:NAD+ synthase